MKYFQEKIYKYIKEPNESKSLSMNVNDSLPPLPSPPPGFRLKSNV